MASKTSISQDVISEDAICLNSPALHCRLSSHPHCIKMLGFCFCVYVCRSQGAGTDPAKDSMPRACRCEQGLPSDLTNDSLCLHLVEGLWDDPAQDSMPRACRCELDALKYPIFSVLRKETDFLQPQ